MYPDRTAAEEILREAEQCNPGPWGDHSRTAAHCAGQIAIRAGMDPDKAYVLGLLHDIGRKFGKRHLGHVPDGYRYMMRLGYDDCARICITHSFQVQRFDDYIGNTDTSPEETALVKRILYGTVYDDYDRLIQLCDSFAGASGVLRIEERLEDVQSRYGGEPAIWERKTEAVLRLKKYFEMKMGQELYAAVDKEHFRPGQTKQEKGMICFLTSAHDLPGHDRLNPANGFTDILKKYYPSRCRALYICSDPDRPDSTDRYSAILKAAFEHSGFFFERFRTLDGRNAANAPELIADCDLILLAGGSVAKQNRFFRAIGLRELIRSFTGIVIGISAGSMNSAEIVYAQPELAGEATDPGFDRFPTGLGLTKVNLLPHYTEVKDDVVDGLRVFEDIAYPDSMGRTFYAIPDGTFLFINGGTEELRGEAWIIRDGKIRRISEEGDTIPLQIPRQR